ncbi:hypothetical protein WR164_03890 [Philodulcilactobacillus myokoensis]|uniref:Uncharacterized protein n=1 Tax=Philodulcilactobacillus myokoensis TaxID=2929573 RepID=A0A9W6B0R5_9LACO|nr:hypothetical protein [Philodulcilactobacillus myokoensis]GLB46410.1 hypothetical protein WR164_03890 [Philodulcilactobacillus myokoensis]
MKSKLLLAAAVSFLGLSTIGGTASAKQKLLRIPNQYQKTWQMSGNHDKTLQVYRYTAFYNSKSKSDRYRMRLHFKKMGYGKYGVVTNSNYMPFNFKMRKHHLDVYYQNRMIRFYVQDHAQSNDQNLSRSQHLKLDVSAYNELLQNNSDVPFGTSFNYVNENGNRRDVANSLNYFVYADGDFQSNQPSDYQNSYGYYSVAYVKRMRKNMLALNNIFQDQLTKYQKKQMNKIAKQLSGKITSKNVADYAANINNLPKRLAQYIK